MPGEEDELPALLEANERRRTQVIALTAQIDQLEAAVKEAHPGDEGRAIIEQAKAAHNAAARQSLIDAGVNPDDPAFFDVYAWE